jgi:hypothetical protein
MGAGASWAYDSVLQGVGGGDDGRNRHAIGGATIAFFML